MAKKNTSRSHVSANVKAERAERRALLESDIKAMAAKANARLRALEKNNMTAASNAYRYLERRHFDKDTAIAEDRSGRIKFDTSLKKKSAQQLIHEKTELQRFLYQSKTSTVRGVKDRYNRAFDTFIRNHPNTKIDRATFDRIASTEGFRAYVQAFGSSQIAPLMSAAANAAEVSDEALSRITDAIAQVTPSMSIDEFNRQALPPSDWLYNQAEEDGEFLPDASAWGIEDEDGFIYLDNIPAGDEWDALPKTRSPRKSGRRKR